MNSLTELTPSETENKLEEKSVLRWKIDLKDMLYIRTAAFAPVKRVDTKFCFEVWFQRKDKGKTNESASLQVIFKKLPESSARSDLRFEFSVFVYCSNGSLFKDCKLGCPISVTTFTENTCINSNSAIYQSDGSYSTEGSKLSKNKLTLKCQMNFFGHVFSPLKYHKAVDSLLEYRSFFKNFEALYQSDELCDVSVQVGDKTFRSHKFVLAAHSPVLKTMLTQDFQEAKTGVITISDFEPDVIESFLKFLYTGEVEDKSFSNCKQLYSLADKYDVQILKQKCFKILTGSTLNEDQIMDVLQIAHQYNDENLRKAAKQLLLLTIKE